MSGLSPVADLHAGRYEVASGATTDRSQLRRTLNQLAAGEVLMVNSPDRLTRSTRDLAGRMPGLR